MAIYVKTNSELYHGGPGSGRYPWGSGDRPYQRLEQAHGGIFKRKPKTTKSMRVITSEAQERINATKGKSSSDIRKEREDREREEKYREEHPMASMVKNLNEKAKTIERDYQEKKPEEKREEAKAEEPTNFKKVSKEETPKQTEKSEPPKAKEKVQETAPAKLDDRAIRNNPKNTSDMTTEELKAYNNRRREEDTYNKYRSDDAHAPWKAAHDAVDGGKKAYESIRKSIEDKYVQQHKDLKKAKADAELADMSDDELQRRVKRMNLENQYRNLSPEVVIEGEATTKKILSIVGTTMTVAELALPVAESFTNAFKNRR